MSSTLGQMASCQLDAVSSHSTDDPETRARRLSVLGKYLRLQAVQEEPIYLWALWDGRQQVDNSQYSHVHSQIILSDVYGSPSSCVFRVQVHCCITDLEKGCNTWSQAYSD